MSLSYKEQESIRKAISNIRSGKDLDNSYILLEDIFWDYLALKFSEDSIERWIEDWIYESRNSSRWMEYANDQITNLLLF